MPTTPTDSVYALRPCTKMAGEVLDYAADFGELLDASETLTGTPTVTALPAGLTIGTPAVNSTALTDPEGNTIGIGQAVQVQIAGGQKGRYELTILCGSSAGGGRIRGGKCILLVDV